MKRSLIAAALLLSVMITCFSGHYLLNSITDDIIVLSDTALKFAEENNIDQMISTAQKIRDIWTKKESILSVITPHGETESMDEIIEKIVYFAENNKTDRYKECCIELKTKMSFIKDEDKLSIKNIF